MLFEYIGFFFMLLTSLVGIFSIIKVITEWIFDDSEIIKKITILPLHKTDERFEMMLKTFLTNNKGTTLIADMGLDAASLTVIKELIKNRSEVSLIDGKCILACIDEML